MIDLVVLLALNLGIGLLIGALVSVAYGDLESAILLGIALLVGLSMKLALICAIVLAIAFGVKGYWSMAGHSIGGFIVGMLLWMGLAAVLGVSGFILAARAPF